MERLNVHGTCVTVGRAGESLDVPADFGVLLIGASGTGKSDLALRLIERGAVLVADDRVDLFVAQGTLRARAPARLAGLIEVRGVGIVSLPCAPEATVGLAVELANTMFVQRMPEKAEFRPFALCEDFGRACAPLIRLSGLEASAAAKVLVAAGAIAHARILEDRKTL